MKLKKPLFYFFGFTGLLILSGLIFNLSLLNYGLSQLKGQLHVIINAQPIEKVLADPLFPDSLKNKLILIQEINAFAMQHIGINPSNNYTSVYDQKGKPVLWVLTASDPYQLKEYEWSFPFLGNVSYKGFFEYGRGEIELEKLKSEGYDAELGAVGAWSTLGWFNDPILSNMLNRNEGDLANLVIHELTHNTLFVKDDVDFNENLASFIGHQGALRFLVYKFGENSPQMQKYLESSTDEKVYNDYINKSALRLDSLYMTMDNQQNHIKEELKNNMLKEIISQSESLELHNKQRYTELTKKIENYKNAFFLSYIRYGAKQDDFEQELDMLFKNDLKAYLLHLKALYPSL
ncbi:MAG: aminopeptidase [Bacteroidetes bacterium]|nr:aminopeptidase [Bacteroidota bacterium]HET6245852.1 aminopeptidase [Bacteroidia bacterium]